jgi:calcineurin-like phosphoesterase family protein
MPATWFTSDTHFCHGMVAGLRGFTSATGHDETLIERWNAVVRPDDLVWHLGDAGLGNETQVLERIGRLNGRIHLITGNHDPVWPGHRDSRKKQRRWLEAFESVQAFARTRLGTRMVLLSHFPYESDHTTEARATQYRLRDEGMWLLHGHTHMKNRLGTCPHYVTMMDPVSGDGISFPRGREVHVGLDAWDLRPVSEAEVVAVMRDYEDSQHPSVLAAGLTLPGSLDLLLP